MPPKKKFFFQHHFRVFFDRIAHIILCDRENVRLLTCSSLTLCVCFESKGNKLGIYIGTPFCQSQYIVYIIDPNQYKTHIQQDNSTLLNKVCLNFNIKFNEILFKLTIILLYYSVSGFKINTTLGNSRIYISAYYLSLSLKISVSYSAKSINCA